jgi:hypothetical protein
MAQAQKAYQDLYAPMHEAMKKSQKALDDILTPEQREKLQENRMATLIKTLTDPVQLSGEQLGKVKAAYREAAKKGEARRQRIKGGKLPDYQVVQRALGPATVAAVSEPTGWFFKGVLLPKETLGAATLAEKPAAKAPVHAQD